MIASLIQGRTSSNSIFIKSMMEEYYYRFEKRQCAIIRKRFQRAVRDIETQRNSTGRSTLLGICVYSCMGKTDEIEGRIGRADE